MKRPSILLSEGSSTNARETLTALGVAGYRADVCDPNPVCLCRASRFVGRVHPCPASGEDPVGYLQTVIELLQQHHYDVLLPVNEQAYLFAWARETLDPLTRLAVASFASFTRVQTKTAFTVLLDELSLPHPPTRIVHTGTELGLAAGELGYPCWIKTAEGTASMGVWCVRSPTELSGLLSVAAILRGLEGADGLIVQAQAGGRFEQAHAVFDNGSLVAVRADRRLAEGTNGGPALKVGVARPVVADHLRRVGRELSWHGGFSVDYFWDEDAELPAYVDANPRLTEPMNSLVNGVNLADLQVRVALGEPVSAVPDGTLGFRSHGVIHALLGAAVDGTGRRGVLATAVRAATHRGEFAGSTEGLTPLRLDPLSVVTAGAVLAQLLVDPGRARTIATETITSYSLGQAIPLIAASTPAAFGLADPAVG